MSRKVIIAGSSGHCSVIVDALLSAGAWEIAGLLDSALEAGAKRHGYPILGKVEDAARIVNLVGCKKFFVAAGDNWIRRELTRRIAGVVEDVEWINVIHPHSTVSGSAQLGAGVAILAGAIAGAGSEIGDGALLNTGSSADHDCRLGPFSSLAPGVHLGGAVSLGEGTGICIGATVRHAVQVGSWTIVGAGATVLSDLPGGVLAYGTPARVIRSREPDEQYLD